MFFRRVRYIIIRFEVETETGVVDGAVAGSWGQRDLGFNPKSDAPDVARR